MNRKNEESSNTQDRITSQYPIVALASGKAPSAIAILRITGQGCLGLLEKILKVKSNKELKPSAMKLCDFVDPTTSTIIDEPMAVFFEGPRSYTGEDSVEIYLHGGPYIIQTCLKILWSNGFTAAKPGEFTERAFLNGKLDLTAAEGIKEIIDANSNQQWMAARQLASGKLAAVIEDLRLKLVEAMAWLEARIDFPDEKETSAVEMQEVKTRVETVKQVLLKLESSYEGGRIAANGLSVALFGKPNCGKSTLMNELLQEERAIVTSQAGTTRDYLEESCHIDGRLIRIIDTAGIRETTDEVEKIGVARSIEIAKKADLVLFMLPSDASSEDEFEIEKWISEFENKNLIRVVSKSDLGKLTWKKDQVEISCPPPTVPQTSSSDSSSASAGVSTIANNTPSSHGVDSLKKLLSLKVDSHVAPLEEETFITSARHLNAITEALGFVRKFEEGISEELFEEMLAFELQSAAKSVATIIGKIDNDDVLETIFGSFCVGK